MYLEVPEATLHTIHALVRHCDDVTIGLGKQRSESDRFLILSSFFIVVTTLPLG